MAWGLRLRLMPKLGAARLELGLQPRPGLRLQRLRRLRLGLRLYPPPSTSPRRYRGFKVMPYSCACNTPLSNFEVQ